MKRFFFALAPPKCWNATSVPRIGSTLIKESTLFRRLHYNAVQLLMSTLDLCYFATVGIVHFFSLLFDAKELAGKNMCVGSS